MGFVSFIFKLSPCSVSPQPLPSMGTGGDAPPLQELLPPTPPRPSPAFSLGGGVLSLLPSLLDLCSAAAWVTSPQSWAPTQAGFRPGHRGVYVTSMGVSVCLAQSRGWGVQWGVTQGLKIGSA